MDLVHTQIFQELTFMVQSGKILRTLAIPRLFLHQQHMTLAFQVKCLHSSWTDCSAISCSPPGWIVITLVKTLIGPIIWIYSSDLLVHDLRKLMTSSSALCTFCLVLISKCKFANLDFPKILNNVGLTAKHHSTSVHFYFVKRPHQYVAND